MHVRLTRTRTSELSPSRDDEKTKEGDSSRRVSSKLPHRPPQAVYPVSVECDYIPVRQLRGHHQHKNISVSNGLKAGTSWSIGARQLPIGDSGTVNVKRTSCDAGPVRLKKFVPKNRHAMGKLLSGFSRTKIPAACTEKNRKTPLDDALRCTTTQHNTPSKNQH